MVKYTANPKTKHGIVYFGSQTYKLLNNVFYLAKNVKIVIVKKGVYKFVLSLVWEKVNDGQIPKI